MEAAAHDLSRLVGEMLPLLRAAAGPTVSVRSDLARGLSATMLDPVGLGLVVVDLVITARDALHDQHDDRLVIVRTRLQRVVHGPSEPLAAGPYAVLEVTCNGVGTGGGLATVQRYAGQLGGLARVTSTPGAGTTVQVFLPLEPRAQALADEAEAQRLAALHRHAILDTGPESGFDALVHEAASLCGAPIALISLVDDDRQWFKARVGLAVSQTPRTEAFCDHAIADPLGMLVVPDTHVDARFSGNPLVLGDPHVRFYAGMALHDAEGHALGALCVLDQVPRELDAAKLADLRALSLRVAGLLRSRVAAVAPARAPVWPSVQRAGEAGRAAPHLPPARVLVVDDEPELRELACTWLESLGYTVALADCAAQALDVLQARDFEVLFTDVVMPGGMDGLELARQAQRKRPGLRVVLTSGYASRLQLVPELPGVLLPKPYRKKDLERAFAGLPPALAAEAHP
jgi:CheY-like chemotaxis protein